MSEQPARTVLPGPFGAAMAVDVEEWYHTCWVADYVDPRRRPPLTEELDVLLPALLDRFAAAERRATFFVLGEVARARPALVRRIADAGHEIACHGHWHLRVDARTDDDFRRDLEDARRALEDAWGGPVVGYRAPEWSLRRWTHPHLRRLPELGFAYDSSLMPAPFVGTRRNPQRPTRLAWPDAQLIEVPPLTWAGPLRLPAGGWTGRLMPWRWIAGAARRALTRGDRLPLYTIHPWELVDRPIPGPLRGVGRWMHDLGRRGHHRAFDALLRALPWTSIRDALDPARRAADAGDRPVAFGTIAP
ncbi:MAG: polysaccharide deacetylase family protein [Acidobacteriota bacterium]